MSRAEFARQLGESEMWLGRRLNDQVSISIDDLARMAKALDVPLGALLPMEASA